MRRAYWIGIVVSLVLAFSATVGWATTVYWRNNQYRLPGYYQRTVMQAILTDHKRDINTLIASVQSLTTRVASLEARMTAAETNIATNQANITINETAIAANAANLEAEEAARIAADSDLQGQIDAIEPVQLGAWETKEAYTWYQAATDGFVIAQGALGGGSVQLFVDVDADGLYPSDIQLVEFEIDASGGACTITAPVRKGQYWRAMNVSAGSDAVYWVPLE